MIEWSQAGAIIGELTGENQLKSHVTYEIVDGDNFDFFTFVPESILLRHSLTVAHHHKNIE